MFAAGGRGPQIRRRSLADGSLIADVLKQARILVPGLRDPTERGVRFTVAQRAGEEPRLPPNVAFKRRAQIAFANLGGEVARLFYRAHVYLGCWLR